MTASISTGTLPLEGERAPDFSLASTAGEQVSLSSFRGRENALLAFFPLAFTSTCTAQLCAFTEDFDSFETAGTRVLPISVDSVPTLAEFRAKHDMKVHLLSDFRREASRAYGVLMPETYFSKRAYFLIDRAGIVRWVHVEEKLGMRRENGELLERIAALR